MLSNWVTACQICQISITYWWPEWWDCVIRLKCNTFPIAFRQFTPPLSLPLIQAFTALHDNQRSRDRKKPWYEFFPRCASMRSLPSSSAYQTTAGKHDTPTMDHLGRFRPPQVYACRIAVLHYRCSSLCFWVPHSLEVGQDTTLTVTWKNRWHGYFFSSQSIQRGSILQQLWLEWAECPRHSDWIRTFEIAAWGFRDLDLGGLGPSLIHSSAMRWDTISTAISMKIRSSRLGFHFSVNIQTRSTSRWNSVLIQTFNTLDRVCSIPAPQSLSNPPDERIQRLTLV